MEQAVKCTNLVKSFGKGSNQETVLRTINLEIKTGSLSMIAGPSGCGKTTLLSILACTLRPTAGQVTVFGQDVGHMSKAAMTQFRRRDIGFIFQQYNLIPALSAEENAAIPLIIAGTPYKFALEAARRALAKFSLSEHAKKLPKQLSGGQQQRVAVARALVHKPRLVICDEPTAALDSASGDSVMQTLKEIATAPKRAVIVVTHDQRIFHYADRLIEMSDGEVLPQTSTHERNTRPRRVA